MSQVTRYRSQHCAAGDHNQCDGWGYTSDLRQTKCKCSCNHAWTPERRRGLEHNRELFRHYMGNRKLSAYGALAAYLADDSRYVDTFQPERASLGWLKPEEDPPDPATYSDSPIHGTFRSGVL